MFSLEEVNVTVFSTADPVGFNVTLTETGFNTGNFTGAITLVSGPSNSTALELQVELDGLMVVLYHDADPLGDVFDEATIGLPTETYCLYPEADTFVDKAHPATAYGNDTYLQVTTRSGADSRTLLRFPLYDLPPGNIISATLKLYVETAPIAGRTYEVHEVSGWWDEYTTWDTQPGIGGFVDDASVGTGAAGTWIEWDVTPTVQAILQGWMGNDGFYVVDSNEGARTKKETLFSSNETAVAAHKPRLCVELSLQPDWNLYAYPDWQMTFPGGSAEYWIDVQSLNGFEGNITFSVTGLHATMNATFDPPSVYLNPNDRRSSMLNITTGKTTPADEYELNVKGTDEYGTVKEVPVHLQIMMAPVTRDLPASTMPDSIFTVNLTYTASQLNATGIIIKERLPQFVNFTGWADPMPDVVDFQKNAPHDPSDDSWELRWLNYSSPLLGNFWIAYNVTYNPPPGWGGGDLWWWGDFEAIDRDGEGSGGPVLGDQRVQIQVGLPGPWDDDGWVDDWDLLQAIHLWSRDGMTEAELLQYIILWRSGFGGP